MSFSGARRVLVRVLTGESRLLEGIFVRKIILEPVASSRGENLAH